MNHLKNVSVIIPTKNSEKTIKHCLKSLSKQTNINECIIIDSYSKDKTRKIAEQFRTKIILTKGGPGKARNIGVKHAKGYYIQFLDSDQIIKPGTIYNCIKTCENTRVEAVKIPENFMGTNYWGACSARWKNEVVKTWGQEGGIPRFFKKTALKQDFNNSAVWWEDQELYDRLDREGLKSSWCEGEIIHIESGTLSDYVKKYYNYGASTSEFSKKSMRKNFKEKSFLTLNTFLLLILHPRGSLSKHLGSIFLTGIKLIAFILGATRTHVKT
jgi:glycosyltransferase involved in cell wall biosynthesis